MYDEAQDAVAAEYVLGTLSADEREHAEALLAIDPGFAEAVHMWERRLGELNVMVEAVEPPPPLWDKIRAEITDAAPPSESPLPAIADAAPMAQIDVPSGEHPSLADGAATALSSSGDQAMDQSNESPAVAAAQSSSAPAAESVALAAVSKIERSAVVYLSRRVNFWRQMTMAAGAIAALLAIFIAVAALAPGRLGLVKVAPAPVEQGRAALGARLVAALQQGPTGPAFLLTVDPQRRNLIVRRVSATPETGRSYELWLMSRRFPTPRSLGVVGNDEYTERAIPAGLDDDAIRDASYAVSLEPAGGSPSGVPTGPILFTGKLVDTVPPAAPSTPAKSRT